MSGQKICGQKICSFFAVSQLSLQSTFLHYYASYSTFLLLSFLHNYSQSTTTTTETTTTMPSWTDIAGFCLATLVAPFTFLQLWAFIFPNGKISKRLYPSLLDPADKALLERGVRALQAPVPSSLDPADKALLERGVRALEAPVPSSLDPADKALLQRGVHALEALVLQGSRAPQPNPFGDVELVTTVRPKTN
jgi:hypothetical protein